MCYDMVISEVKKDVKDEVVTLDLRLMLRLDLVMLDLIPSSRKSKGTNIS